MTDLVVTLRLARPGFELDLDERLPGGGVTALFGPSGSGKTTVLRCVAGLEPTAAGRVVVAGATWLDSAAGTALPVHLRGVGYVFQEAALFPHLDVRGNLEFGRARTPPAAQVFSPGEVAGWFDLTPLLSRRVGGLSGGERQRVAIARAVLAGPRLLLFDEPLAGLDYARREAFLPYLERLWRRLEIPVLYVTHDQAEAARLADTVLLIDRGRVVGRGDAGVLPRGGAGSGEAPGPGAAGAAGGETAGTAPGTAPGTGAGP